MNMRMIMMITEVPNDTNLGHLLHLQNSSLTLDPSGGNTRHSDLREKDTNGWEILPPKERNTNGWKMGNMKARKIVGLSVLIEMRVHK